MPRSVAALRQDDVVLVSFPFTDLSGQKVRPALIVGRPLGDDVLVAFITSRKGDAMPKAEYAIAPGDPEFAGTGLRAASRVRLNKLATLHRAVVRRQLGRIGPRSRRRIDGALRYVLEQ